MTAEKAMAFVEARGVVLASARGPVPRLTEAIVGEPIEGSWWAHSKGHEIFAVLQALGDSPDILVCRLVGGKITFVHRRLWPALVRAATHFSAHQLAQVRQEHTASGHHVNREVAFPNWVPPEIIGLARNLSEREALDRLGPPVRASRPTREPTAPGKPRPTAKRRH